MAITVDSLTVYVAVAYVSLFATAIYLVYGGFGRVAPQNSFPKKFQILAWFVIVGIIVVPPLFFLMQMNQSFKQVFDAFKIVDVASNNITHAFRANRPCDLSIFDSVSTFLVRDLFYAEYGAIIDLIAYFDTFADAFWGLGSLVLGGPHLIAFAVWWTARSSRSQGQQTLTDNLKPSLIGNTSYNLVFIMLIFLAFQIVFPGMVSFVLGLLYFTYLPKLETAENSLTAALKLMPNLDCSTTVFNCTTAACDMAELLIELLNVTKLDGKLPGSLEPAYERCMPFIEQELCTINNELTVIYDDASDLDTNIVVYNYVAVACVVVFIVASAHLLLIYLAETGNVSTKSRTQKQRTPYSYTRVPMKETLL